MGKRKKVILLSLLTIGIIAISISAFAYKKALEYDEKGRLKFHAGEKLTEEIAEGTPGVLVVPDINANVVDESSKKEKEEFALENSNNIQALNINDDIEDFLEENPLIEILQKYYGTEEIEKLYNQVSEEKGVILTLESDKDVSPTQIELLKMTCELIEDEKLSVEEKETLKTALKSIDLSGLNDESLKQKINSY